MMWAFAWQNLITRPSRTTLAVVGLTIPVLAFLGLFSISQGIRDLMGNTLGKMQGLMVLRENSPSPVFSDLPADMAKTLRKIPGVRVVAPEVWKIAPPIDGRGGLGSAAIGMLFRPREEAMKSIASTIMIEGQDLPEHLKLKNALFAMSILPKERGGGRFLNLGDIGKQNVVISTKIARDYPNADGTPKKVGQTLRIGNEDFTIVGLYETGSLVTDVTDRHGDRRGAEAARGGGGDGIRVRRGAGRDRRDRRAGPADRGRVAGGPRQRISQFNLKVGEVMGKLDLFLLFAVGLALLVGGVGIANTMLMSTSERYVEFGVMRTNGWTRRNILFLVTAESALLGLLSGVIGCALAAAAVFTVNRFLSGFALDLRPWPIAASLAGAGDRNPRRDLPRLESLDDDADGRDSP